MWPRLSCFCSGISLIRGSANALVRFSWFPSLNYQVVVFFLDKKIVISQHGSPCFQIRGPLVGSKQNLTVKLLLIYGLMASYKLALWVHTLFYCIFWTPWFNVVCWNDNLDYILGSPHWIRTQFAHFYLRVTASSGSLFTLTFLDCSTNSRQVIQIWYVG